MPVDTWLTGYLLSFGAQVEIIEPKYLKGILAEQDIWQDKLSGIVSWDNVISPEPVSTDRES